MAGVQLKKVIKKYPNGFEAVKGVDLDIKDGEFMVFVGPSGCAKSTTLRMIAGLESITEGEIFIGGKKVNNLLPKDRGISMVFQNYALYPHMTTYQNMAFGLKNAKYPKDEINRRVADAAKKLEMEELLDRKPKELSGGQCQRVAVGRAIVRKPDVFLFDEPLSNLDAKLRVSMRINLMNLHRQLKEEGLSSTMIYVTHDQIEAMTMGDRICVLNDGQIMQVDSPINLYHYPKNVFVAGFIGSPAMNIESVKLDKEKGVLHLTDDFSLPLDIHYLDAIKDYQDHTIWFGLRPEHITVNRTSDEGLKVTITNIERMGNEDLLHCNLDMRTLIVRSVSTPDWMPSIGEKIQLIFDLSHLHLFDSETEQSIIGNIHKKRKIDRSN